MRSNRKGFTLIELLAVIVILAIIALIATPIVLNIITKARRSASVDSLYGVMAAARTTYMSTLLDAEQVTLPAYVECDGTDCKIFQADATTTDGETTYAKGAAQNHTVNNQSVQFTVNFSGTVPTKGGFVIDNNGKVVDVVADSSNKDSGIWVNGFQCSIENENAKC